MNKDYLSEFENEFEIDDFSSEYESEVGDGSDEEFETHDEYELDDEYEMGDQYESDEEFEFDDQQQELENYPQEYGSRDQEFESRLYSALNGEYESSFEMEQEIDRVLYEMEVEYFWKSAKKLWKKHKNKILPIAKRLIPGGAISGLAKLAGGDVRGLLKQGLSMAANAYLPGVGGVIAGKLLNSEMANANNPQEQARQTVKVAKDAYRNMAKLVPNLRRNGNLPNQIRNLSSQALTMAQKKHSVYKGKNKQVIPIKSGSIVVVRPDRIIIYS